MNWILRYIIVRKSNKTLNNIKPIIINGTLCEKIQAYECKKCGSAFPIDSFPDKPENITCLACYVSEE
jgi:formylmethanofuran dehydrogenase subunit E